ncbi:AMP-binding protein [Pseudonocardia sp. KRD291]|uniref:AMP-binding protein n=1 Tax=Pseudonocardia sp. KRD291 TaxID=2792007 RepID=UPI001C4A70CF|nr:AMP-binding protein [Pseudonocardia sp. KRD291]MBW0102736.1 AMP-binding protein [Pseudonocardia sp. KRD291]
MVGTPVLPARAASYRDEGHWRDRTHLDDLRDAFSQAPDRRVLVDRSQGGRREMSVADLVDRTERLAAGLSRFVSPGEPVAYLLPNRWEAIALFYACARIGAVAVPMPTSLGPTQVTQRLRSTGAVLAVTNEAGTTSVLADVADDLPALRTRVAIDAAPEGVLDLHRDVAAEPHRAPDEPSPDEIGSDDVALVLFTSGTTGTSKAVLHTPNTLHASVRGQMGSLLSGDDAPRVLTPSVATHAIGIMASVLSPVVHGHDAVLVDDDNASHVLAVCAEEDVTLLMVGPSGYDGLLDRVGDGATPPPSLRTIALGGAPLADAVRRKSDRIPAVLRIHWGMTEVPGGGVSGGDDDEATSWHTMGHPVPGLERVADDGADGGGGIAPVHVRGPQVCVGIVDSGDGSTVWTPADDDGWFATGDLASADPTGVLAFVDRASDEIKGPSGMIIPTAEVEELLAAHPDVGQVVLVAYRPGVQAEAPAAVVVPQDGREPDLDSLTRFLRERGTTEWYLPQRVEIVQSLPRNPQGKVDKKALRAQLDKS